MNKRPGKLVESPEKAVVRHRRLLCGGRPRAPRCVNVCARASASVCAVARTAVVSESARCGAELVGALGGRFLLLGG
jgi:hypothetical protein